MALNRAAINNSLLNKISQTQSVDEQSIKVLEVGVQKPEEIQIDSNSINIDREIFGGTSIKSANLSKSVVDNSYVKEVDEPQSFTSKLLNFIEPYDYKGVLKTTFYTDISTNYSVGDKVFIVNGIYDSPMGTSVDKFERGVDGYEILAIDGCKVVLDINYVGKKPYNDFNLEDFIFIHNVEDQQEFEYLNSIKTFFQQIYLGNNNTLSSALKSQFSGLDDGSKLNTFSGHLIRVSSSKNFLATNQMTQQSIFGELNLGVNGASPPPNPKYGSKIFFRELQSTIVGGNTVYTWGDCTQYFAENKILLRDDVHNPSGQIGNKKIYIFGKDFDFNGVTFKEGIVYTYNETLMNWEMDQFYKPSYISKLYFIEGTFTGNHRSGLFGSYNKKNVWEGKGDWQGGTVLNTIWKSGKMDSKTKVGDVVTRARISPDGKSVIQSIDTTNNSGTGYNDVVDSIIEKGSFYNANFKNCFLGVPNFSLDVVDEYIANNEDINSISSSLFDVYTDSSRLDFCDVTDTYLSSTTLYDSLIKNCGIFGSKLSNGQIKNSIFYGGEYNADTGIKILGAEVNSYDRNIGSPNINSDIFGILKLFISDEDFFRFSKGDAFYIEKVNKEFFVTSLDEHFRIHLPYETKYMLDLYWDYEFSDDNPQRPNSVSVRDKRQNRLKFYVAKNETANLVIPKATPKVGVYWEDITSIWSGAWTIDSDSSIITNLFYVYRNNDGIDASIPGSSIGNETFHIFHSGPAILGDPLQNGDGPAPIDGFTPNSGAGWVREYPNAYGPYEPTSPGQYRGEFSTDPSTIALSIGGGLSIYQKDDIVQFFNPVTSVYTYYRALQDIPQAVEGQSYDIVDYLAANANTKFQFSERSSFSDYCSIDIESSIFGYIRKFRGNTVISQTDNWTYLNKFSNNSLENLLPFAFIDKAFRNVQIKNAHFDSGLFLNSNWIGGSYINDYDNIIAKSGLNKYNMTQISYDTLFQNKFYSRNNKNRLKVGEYVWIDPIRYREGTQIYKLQNISFVRNISNNDTTNTKTIELQNDSVLFNSNALLGVFEIERSEYTSHASICKLRIENSTIFGGKFRRANFYNTTFKVKSNYVKPENNLIDPSKVALIMNQIFLDNNLTIDGGFVYQSQIVDLKINGGYLYFCYLNGANFGGGEFINGYWVNGDFAGGKFLNSRASNPVSIKSSYLQNTFRDTEPYLQTLWLNGRFKSGEFYDSEWIDGNFDSGKFWKSDWFGGTWSNGILGDQSIPYTKTTFAYYPQRYDTNLKFYLGNSQSNWLDGECRNAIVGGNGRVYWYGGRMVGGEFTSFSYSISTQSIWYDGIFDGSVFTEQAKWKNGTFNNGKFLSKLGSQTIHYEDTFSVTINANNSFDQQIYDNFQNKDTYGWEYGIFNGGEFGSGDISKYNNSIWHDGIFNGGIFHGRLWKNGIFSGGKFYGMGGTKPIDPNLVSTIPETRLEFSPNLEPSATNGSPELLFWQDYTDYSGYWQRLNSSRWFGGKFEFGEFYGLWFDGFVIENPIEIYSNQKVESELVRATDIRKTKEPVLMDKILWNTGTFSHENGTFRDSLFMSGNFLRGNFDGGVFNPLVPRTFNYDSLFLNLSYSEPNYIKWTNGLFVTGSFYCSKWENGTFKNGFMAGSHWQDGVWEYGTAKNILFDGGTWKNGNWYGAPFDNTYLQQLASTVFVNPSRHKEWTFSVDYFMSLLPSWKKTTGSEYTLSISNPRSQIYISNIFSASLPVTTNVKTGQFGPASPPLSASPYPVQASDKTWTASMTEKYSVLRTSRSEVADIRGVKTFVITTKYENKQTSFWKQGTTLNFVGSTSSIIQDGVEYVKPILTTNTNFTYAWHYYTDFSPNSELTNVVNNTSVAPYRRGYNNLYKGQLPNTVYDLVWPDPSEDYSINNQDSAVSARNFARRGNTTSVFTESNVLYTMDLYVSVELAKEVAVDVWVGGLSYSRFNLQSYEFYYPNDKKKDGVTTITESEASNFKLNLFRTDYYPRYYKITLVYYTTDELISITDGKFFWVKKSSSGILRIHRWTITEQYISYHPDYNNILYPSIGLDINDPVNGGKKITIPFQQGITKYVATSRQNLPIKINWGNGLFRQGIWESGVWNNGYRVNSSLDGFFASDDILKANEIFSVVQGVESTQWFITISFLDSVSDYILKGYKLSTGSKVSVSNLASYDTTGKRRVIFSIMEVIDIDFPNNLIKLQYKTQNNISTIVKDSDFHLIYLSVNVWKNGAFLNGVFRGIFNNGIVVSNPLNVEMFHTHIMNAYFDGGHFISNIDTTSNITYQTSLIQDMDFFDRNIATSGKKRFRSWFDLNYTDTSKSHIKKAGSVFRSKKLQGQLYGATNQYSDPPTTGRVVSSNIMVPNLSGFITNDVLKSSSSFRDTNSMDSNVYSLGTKRTRFSNFYPNDGNFSVPISSIASSANQLGISPFQSFGLTFSLIRQQIKNSSTLPPTGNPQTRPFTFSVESNTTDLNSGLLSLSIVDSIALANLHDYSFLLRNTQINTTPNRYYEFSMKLAEQTTLGGRIFMDDVFQYMNEKTLGPAAATDGLVGDLTPSSIIDLYVNHAETPSSEKVEYFFNKNNVDIFFEMRSPLGPSKNILGADLIPSDIFPPGPSAIYIQNISLYEVDMIPFFNYFTFGGTANNEIDLGVNSIYSAIAPNREIINSDFEFIDDDKLKISYELLVSQNPSINIINFIPTYSEVIGQRSGVNPPVPDWPY